MTSKNTMVNKVVAAPVLDRPLRGIAFMLLMTACFSSLDASAKFLSAELPLWMVMWGRYLFHFVFVAIFFLPKAPKKIITSKDLKLQILRSTLIFCAGVTFWAGLIYLPLAECTVIAFASPLLVTVLSVILLGERFGFYRFGCVIIGLVGVIIVIRPGFGIAHWAVVMPVCAAFFYALLQITTRVLGQKDSVWTTLFYTSVCGLVLSSILVAFFWQTPSPMQWLMMMWLGFIAATGHFFMIRAFEAAPVSVLAPFDYTTLIWATLLGYLIFGDLPDGATVLGASIIILSGLYLIGRENR